LPDFDRISLSAGLRTTEGAADVAGTALLDRSISRGSMCFCPGQDTPDDRSVGRFGLSCSAAG
jgi:hypothetical protein